MRESAEGINAENVKEAFAIASDGRDCQCSCCLRVRRFVESLESIPPQHHAMLHALFGALEDAEFERDYLSAIVAGSWPDADAIIEYRRRGFTASAPGTPPANPAAQ